MYTSYLWLMVPRFCGRGECYAVSEVDIYLRRHPPPLWVSMVLGFGSFLGAQFPVSIVYRCHTMWSTCWFGSEELMGSQWYVMVS